VTPRNTILQLSTVFGACMHDAMQLPWWRSVRIILSVNLCTR